VRGKEQAKRGLPLQRAFHFCPATMQLHDGQDDRQSQSCRKCPVATRLIGPIKAIEQPWQVMGLDAGAGIAHADNVHAVRLGHTKANRLAACRIAQRVGDKVFSTKE